MKDFIIDLDILRDGYFTETPISEETIKHISTGTWINGRLKSGAHSEKGFNSIKNKGWFDPDKDVTTLPNGVRTVIMSKHPNTRRRKTPHHFFPKEWTENKIRQVITQIQKDSSISKIRITEEYYRKIAVVNNVRVVVGFNGKTNEPTQSYPDSNQNI